ncbi:MAG TPA: hypothetical protein P5181_03640 [Dermatophilaceae bacterium]|nr:hypothetical protein [Dermatophilaceae bacterium]
MTSVGWVLAAAVCSGLAIILQAQAARQPDLVSRKGSLLGQLLRRPRYLVALALVGLGFAFGALALGGLPLFAVQAGRSASLAVTAAVAVPALGARLGRREGGALVGVGLGLLLMGYAAEPGPAVLDWPASGHWLIPAAAIGLGLIAAAVHRSAAGRSAGWWYAALAGLAFAVLALAVRSQGPLRDIQPTTVLADPAAWTVPAAGLLGLQLSALALRAAPVVPVTATLVVVETVASALAGVLWTGDRPRAGMGWLAVVAFVLVLGSAVSLVRHARPDVDPSA